MTIRRIPKTETLGYRHDCHNRSRIVVTFARRPPIRLCDRCGGFLVENVSQVINNRNGKSHNKFRTKPPRWRVNPATAIPKEGIQ